MSFLSFFGGKKSRRVAVFDIGSGSIAGAIVRIENNKAPHIEYVKRLPLPIKERVQARTITDGTLGALKEISNDILKQKKHLHFVALIFSSPWHTSHTKLISINKDEQFIVSEKFINEIIENEEVEIEKEEKGDLTLIEKRIANMKINGYSTSLPYGKKANKLDLSLYISLLPTAFLNKVQDKLHNFFPIKSTSYHSFPLVSFSVIKQVFQNDKDFIYLDISGEITDILAVCEGTIIGTASFPMGKNHIIRKVVDHFKITPDLADTFVKLFSEKKASEDLDKKIGELSAAVKEEWLAYFYQIITDIYKNNVQPGKVFITSDEDVMQLFASYLPESFNKKVFLGSETLGDFTSFDPYVEHDPFLAIESIYLSSI